ncbi:ATP synthase subunit I [Paenibacillus sacheonensis]|uniref:ATP synthase subunit I n=1 Tax=Paenibacillus sacheonensis TaxID=742054 RepID=A0A7X4YUY8_9BACL|nr:ATP synthase subunit I [Paenibacillus sacheonensis]MBM7566541.1 ATP synthase protein I [Paenibacillus sacheonensis]NBC73042.1 ATP synthase subunit I [Paenibacillus sacheonensis]
MDDLSGHLRTVMRVTFFFLSLCFVGWALFPERESLFGGLVLGTAASLVNAFHLSWKVQRAGANAAAGIKRRGNLGFLTRACIGLLAAVVATRYFSFNVYGTVAGLFVAQLATLILGFRSKGRSAARHFSDERGENN